MHKYKDTDTEYTVKHKAVEEGVKLLYDFLKHLTTLNVGSILIILTVFEKMFTDRSSYYIMIGALALFAVSVLGAVFAMLGLASSVRDAEIEWERKGSHYKSAGKFGVVSFATFILGIYLLAVGVILNIPSK